MKRTLRYLLLVTFSITVQTRDLKSQVNQENDGDAFEQFHQNKMSIRENELNHLETSLENLDGNLRIKRQADEDMNYVSEDPSVAVTDERDQKEETNDDVNYEVRNTLQGVQLPPKTGNPTFSIHADKVYILYPSTFQDPNIFGRFSIPQTINLDPLASKTVTQRNDELQAGQSISSPSLSQLNDSPNSSAYLRGKRQLPSPKREEKKRNVETHLNGSIVVLNQDVNEFNSKESY